MQGVSSWTSGDECLSSSILFRYECSMFLRWARIRRVARGSVISGVMYCEWYGVGDFVCVVGY